MSAKIAEASNQSHLLQQLRRGEMEEIKANGELLCPETQNTLWDHFLIGKG